MKRFITSLFLLTGLTAVGQTILEKEIQHSLNLVVREISPLPGGDFFITANATPAAYDSSMALLIKTDSLLQMKWCKRFKLLHSDITTCITPLSDGNYLIGGAGRENFNLNNGGSLYKMDTAGTVLWHWIYTEANDDAVLKVFEQSNNTLMVFIREGITNYPTKVVLTNSSGSLLSQRIFNIGLNNLFADAVASDGQGNYLMTGTINNTSGSPVLYVLSLNNTTVNWYKEYDFSRNLTNTGIARLSDGNFAVIGSITDSVFTNTYNSYVLKIDLSGNVIWTKEIKQPLAYNEYANAISSLNNAEMTICGHAVSANGFTAFACRLDSSGNVIWSGTYGNYPYQDFTFSYPYSDGRFLFSAFTFTSNKIYMVLTDAGGLSPCNYFPVTLITAPLSINVTSQVVATGIPAINPFSPSFIISPVTLISNLLCSATVGIPVLSENLALNVYPNPSNGCFTIEFTSTKNTDAKIEIINVIGENMFEKSVSLKAGINSFSFCENNIEAGIYFCQFTEGNNWAFQKLIIIK